MIFKINSPKYGEKEILIDEEDYDIVKNYNWFLDRSDKINNFYIITLKQVNNKVTKIYLHRLILNAQKKEYVDHINHNSLDNRKCNLRKCTNAENMWSRGKPKSNKSGYKGVSWEARYKKWQVIISVNKKKKFLGYFNNKEDAARAYNEAALKYHGEFAWLNIIKDAA